MAPIMVVKKPSTPIQQDEHERVESVLAEMTRAMQGEFYVPEGLASGPVVMKDGTYRTTTLAPGQELTFKNFYMTKTGAPTAVFEPVDGVEWTQVEFTLKKLDTFFPLFGVTMAERMNFADTLEAVDDLFRHILKTRENGWREQEEENKRREAELLAAEQAAIRDANPLWGRF